MEMPEFKPTREEFEEIKRFIVEKEANMLERHRALTYDEVDSLTEVERLIFCFTLEQIKKTQNNFPKGVDKSVGV